jgi:hypothetical protein
VAGLLALARQTAADGNAHDVLWAVWDASGLASAWQGVSAVGGSRGAAADRDLDAVCALFDAAARFVVRLPPGSASLFLDSMSGQEIPGDTLAGHAPDGDAVRILTAHRAKGLEWDVVVVSGVQEGIWPDLRMRSSLLGMDELMDAAAGVLVPGTGTDAMAAALAANLLNEESGCSTSPSPAPAASLSSPHPAATTARNGRPGSWPSWPVTRSRSRTSPGPRRGGFRCPRSLPTCAGPRPTRAARPHCAGPPRPSSPGWPLPGYVAPTRGSGTSSPNCPIPGRSPLRRTAC